MFFFNFIVKILMLCLLLNKGTNVNYLKCNFPYILKCNSLMSLLSVCWLFGRPVIICYFFFSFLFSYSVFASVWPGTDVDDMRQLLYVISFLRPHQPCICNSVQAGHQNIFRIFQLLLSISDNCQNYQNIFELKIISI